MIADILFRLFLLMQDSINLVWENMIDTILFDLVGVLLFRKADYLPDPLIDDMDAQIGSVTNDILFKDRMLREYHLVELEFQGCLRKIVQKYEPYSPLWDILPRLKNRFKLGIINNGTYLTYPFFEEKYQLSGKFDVFVSSAVEGVCKPDPAIYLAACERIGCRPRNCLYMDDCLENCLGGEEVGMKVIHWMDGKSGFQAFQAYLLSSEATLAR